MLPRAQRTPKGNHYISPIYSSGYLWVTIPGKQRSLDPYAPIPSAGVFGCPNTVLQSIWSTWDMTENPSTMPLVIWEIRQNCHFVVFDSHQIRSHLMTPRKWTYCQSHGGLVGSNDFLYEFWMIFRWTSCSFCGVTLASFGVNFGKATLPKTTSQFAPEETVRAPKGSRDHLPTIHFQGRKCRLSGG